MPFLVKLGTIWLLLVVVRRDLRASSTRACSTASLPLADPNLQLNGFNPATGEFGTGEPLEGPSRAHPLGTDALARDTFSRLVHGAWVSVIVAVVSVAVSASIVGGLLGSLVGFVRGKTETVIMALHRRDPRLPGARAVAGAGVDLRGPRPVRDQRRDRPAVDPRLHPCVASEQPGDLQPGVRHGRAGRSARRRGRSCSERSSRTCCRRCSSYAMVAAAFVIVVEGTLSFLGLSVQLPDRDVGQHDQPGATRHQDQRLAGAVAVAGRSRSPCCRSTRSATSSSAAASHRASSL